MFPSVYSTFHLHTLPPSDISFQHLSSSERASKLTLGSLGSLPAMFVLSSSAIGFFAGELLRDVSIQTPAVVFMGTQY